MDISILDIIGNNFIAIYLGCAIAAAIALLMIADTKNKRVKWALFGIMVAAIILLFYQVHKIIKTNQDFAVYTFEFIPKDDRLKNGDPIAANCIKIYNSNSLNAAKQAYVNQAPAKVAANYDLKVTPQCSNQPTQRFKNGILKPMS